MKYKDRLERNRHASRALMPYRDRASDAIKVFFYKLAVVACVILVIVLISITNEPPQ